VALSLFIIQLLADRNNYVAFSMTGRRGAAITQQNSALRRRSAEFCKIAGFRLRG
jgi:hypothetical protein